MARWKFVHHLTKIVVMIEADTREEALTQFSEGNTMRSAIDAHPGFWEVSKEPVSKSTIFQWKFVYRCNEISATVEAATVVEAAAKLLEWKTIDLEINPFGLHPEFWELVDGPTDPSEEIPG